MHQLTTTRAARNRRLIAISTWVALIVTAMVLWNGRTQGILHPVESEPAAFLLAAFTTFVSLFAWMLYNPARGVSAETPTLMLAGAATMFTPCVIGFCLMPPDSPLRVWLVIGLFLLLAIAVMSPVPDEFFAIPRERHTYIQPIPILNLSNRSVLEQNPDWFHSPELSLFVETDRLSLAPSAWRFRDRPDSETERRPYPRSEYVDDSLIDDVLVDDIDFDPEPAEVRSVSSPKRRETTVRRDEERRVSDLRAEQKRREELRRAEEQRRINERRRGEEQREEESRRQKKKVHRPATIWFRPRPVKPTIGPSSVPFGPPSPPLSLPRSGSPPADVRPPRTIDLPDRSDQSDPTDLSGRVDSRFSSGMSEGVDAARGATGGIRAKAAGIAGAAAGLAAAAIPSAFRAQTPEIDPEPAGQAGVVDPFVSQLRNRVELREETAPRERHQDDDSSADSTDTIQVADAARQRTFERTRDEYGGELLEGTMTVHFDRGQKRANLHIPFSPPMPAAPEVECEAIGGESLRLKVPERRSYGIRIEARRSDADESMDTEIGFAAVCVAPNPK